MYNNVILLLFIQVRYVTVGVGISKVGSVMKRFMHQNAISVPGIQSAVDVSKISLPKGILCIYVYICEIIR